MKMNVVDKNGKPHVFDPIRRKYVVLTPEEEVRQQVISFLVDDLRYPKSVISVEKSIRLHGMARRYDIVVYSGASPWMIVECKSRSTPITQDTFDQIGHYNIALKVPYLYVTNAIQHYILMIDMHGKEYSFLKEMPAYPTGQA